MRPVNPRITELLSDGLTFELTVTNTYILHARMLDNWSFGKLGKVFYELSIDEMRDADDLINRILMFDGPPNLQKLNAITVGEHAVEMLRLALASEKAAIAQFNAAARECHDLGDHGTASVFEEMVRDEEKHADGSRPSSTLSSVSGSSSTLLNRSRLAAAQAEPPTSCGPRPAAASWPPAAALPCGELCALRRVMPADHPGACVIPVPTDTPRQVRCPRNARSRP